MSRIAELKDALPQLKFLLIGDGSEMQDLRDLAKALEITDRVIFTGWLPNETELNNALASADIGLVMRIGQETDHFHMTDTLNHEMACGKPILAVHLEGIAEFIDDKTNGHLFSPDNPEAFCEKLVSLVRSPEKRQQYGAKALEYSQSICHYERCAAQTLTPIKTVMDLPVYDD